MDTVWKKAQEAEVLDWKGRRIGSEKERWVSLLKKHPDFVKSNRILDIGSGPDGIVFYINGGLRVEVDPLMLSYIGMC